MTCSRRGKPREDSAAAGRPPFLREVFAWLALLGPPGVLLGIYLVSQGGPLERRTLQHQFAQHDAVALHALPVASKNALVHALQRLQHTAEAANTASLLPCADDRYALADIAVRHIDATLTALPTSAVTSRETLVALREQTIHNAKVCRPSTARRPRDPGTRQAITDARTVLPLMHSALQASSAPASPPSPAPRPE